MTSMLLMIRLRKTLILTWLPVLMGAATEANHDTTSLTVMPEAVWAVDPAAPGNDLPQIGYSLFDRLFSVEREGRGMHEVPFPFTELIKAIEARLANEENARARVKQVLIPLGRSLQRHAAAPDYFKYPRVVVAVDSESANPDDPLLKDRLFLGYQEKANLIEVISYNEQYGRFEFQVVRNYGRGTEPKVFYAERAICLSCHQNGGPIFSRAAWSETAANPKIARRLLDEHSVYFGIPVNRSALDPFAIDSSTDRANLLLPYQLLWENGCGDTSNGGRHCRAQALIAALQYRLSSKNHFDNKSSLYQNQFLRVLKGNWAEQWPGGIKIPNPDIPNRNPISQNGRISVDLDPLVLRQPLEIWSVHRAGDVERMIKGIAEAITTLDTHHLDAHLFNHGQRIGVNMRRLHSKCELVNKRFSESKYRVSFDCQTDTWDSNGFAMEGRLYIDNDKVSDGVIDVLRLTEGTVLKRLDFPPTHLRAVDAKWIVALDLYQQPTGLHARLPTGNALHRLELSWPVERVSTKEDATLSVMRDFDPVRDAIKQLVERKQENPFAIGPFQAERTIHALFEQLGIATNKDCCDDAVVPMQLAILDSNHSRAFSENARRSGKTPDMQALHRFCASCHKSSDATFPPNFLLGDSERVTKKLTRCAPRIWYRLNMWRIPEAQRTKSPMPPIIAVQAAEFSVDQWLGSNEFTRLQRYIGTLLKIPSERLLSQDYDTLPACLSDQ